MILATLDEREAKAQLDQARANVAWTTSEVEATPSSAAKQVVAKAEDQRKGTDLDLAKAALALAEKGYADCTIRAPFAGVVTEKKISAGAYIRKGAAICGLVKIDPLRAELAIPEVAVPFIKVGQKGRLNVQSFPDRRFDAVVRYIGPSLRSEARALVVEAIVPNPERLLKPGLFVTAASARETDCLLVRSRLSRRLRRVASTSSADHVVDGSSPWAIVTATPWRSAPASPPESASS